MLQQSSTPAFDNEFPKLDRGTSSTNLEPHQNHSAQPKVDLLAQLDRLEEMILDNPRVPLTGKTMVDEEQLIAQIDAIRYSIPEALKLAREIIDYQERIVHEAQQKAQEIIATANDRAYRIVNDLGIIDRAEQEARQIRQTAIVECEQLKQQTMVEVEKIRTRTLEEIQQMRQEAIAECQEIQVGADEYADRVLHQIEDQLNGMLQLVQRGRSQLQQ